MNSYESAPYLFAAAPFSEQLLQYGGHQYDGNQVQPYVPLGAQLPPAYGLRLHAPLEQEYHSHSSQYHDQRQSISDEPVYSYSLSSLSLDQNPFYPQHHHVAEAVYPDPPPADRLYRAADIPLHSPVPVSGASPPFLAPFQSDGLSPPAAPAEVQDPQPWTAPALGSAAEQQDLMEHYANIPREMFPTPCELLSDVLENTHKDPAKKSSLAVRSAKSDKEETTQRNETLRQARQRFMAESIGFPPTDPDRMSCHDKKRCYLECLEEYVVYLRDQAQLAGLESVELERVPTYRGLNSRSIRTMIVHMEDMVRDMHQNTLQEEATFLSLRDQVLALDEEDSQAHDLRRHPD